MDLREYLKTGILLTDGAMGTYFDEIEPENYLCSEEANIVNPKLIQDIHSAYIENGARLIRSNTFSANERTLQKLKEKRGTDWEDMTLSRFVKAGYDLAVHVAEEARNSGKKVFVAADIGPIYEERDSEIEDILQEYCELADIFLEAGADIFLMETFPDEQYVLKVAQYIRKKNPKAFVMAQFSFVPTGYSRTGFHYKTVLKKAMDSLLLDAVGLNCGIGAAHMEKFLSDYLKENVVPDSVTLTALPNCGYPQIVRGRAVYSDSVAYFGDKVLRLADLGVGILGGCCGTTPEYIGAIACLLEEKKKEPHRRPVRITGSSIAVHKMTSDVILEKENADIKKAAVQKDNNKNACISGKTEGRSSQREALKRNLFREKLESGQPVCAVELDPPFDADVEKVMNGAALLKDSPADIITVADSPLARSRADSLLMAARIQRDTGMAVMPHFACRDRNRISMRSGVLGAYINDIRNILVVTGDPVGRDEREFTKSVFDYNSIKFMKFLEGMNEEIFREDKIYYGGALNQNGANLEKIAERMKKKMEVGCGFFLTQPVYSKEDLSRIFWLQQKTGAKILIGIMPLVSWRNALFIKNEMPGIFVPDEVLERYSPKGTREEWEETAICITKEIMAEGKDIGAGYYYMTPFHRVSLIKKIMGCC